MLSKPITAKVLTLLILFGLMLLSFEAGKHYESYEQAQIIGETTKLFSLLISPSDFESANINWEKTKNDFSISTSDSQEIVKVSKVLAGKQTDSNIDFVLTHEIILYPKGNVPNSNPSEYYQPPLGFQNVEFPGIAKNDQTYCWSSELDNLSECVITIRNTEIIATFDLRIFKPENQLAFELLPPVIMKFVDRLTKSEFGK